MSHTALLDKPRAVRNEDQLDTEAIARYVQRLGLRESADVPQLLQFGGGASNLTYLLVWQDQEWVLRTAPVGTKAASAHDMGREARVLRALEGHFPVPRIVDLCTDHTVIGRDFTLMERVSGLILRQDLPPGVDLSPEAAAALADTWLDGLLRLHRLDAHALGLASLGRGDGYVRRQVDGWTKRYENATTPDAADFSSVTAWLSAHTPEDVGAVLIHNDWRFDNLVLDPADWDRIVGVLDWEMCTIGDPLMDLGGALAYWVEADDDPLMLFMRQQPTHLPGMPTRNDLFTRYLEEQGLSDRVSSPDFYIVFGLFRLAVIVQQIYYRFYHKQTKNPRFAAFVDIATYLQARCAGIVADSSLR